MHAEQTPDLSNATIPDSRLAANMALMHAVLLEPWDRIARPDDFTGGCDPLLKMFKLICKLTHGCHSSIARGPMGPQPPD